MRGATFSFLVSLVLGVAWLAALLGGLLAFLFVYQLFGLSSALAAGFLGTLPGLLAVVLLETVLMLADSRREQRRQTALLEQIRDRLERAPLPDY